MNIQAVSPNFNGVTRSNAQTDKLDAFISMDDSQLRKLAYLKTAENYNDKKSKRVTNGLFYAAPIAAGLKSALFNDGSKTKIFSKEVGGLAGKAARGLKTAALFTGVLAALDVLGFGINKLTNKSEKVKKFNNEHPFLALGALVGAGLGVISLMSRGFGKLASKKAPKFLQKGTEKVAKFLNTNKQLAKMQKGISKLIAKTPSALKNIGAVALDWAPTALLLGGLFHSFSSANAKNRDIAKNYSQLRNMQADLTRERLNQLVVENDTLNMMNEDEDFAGII